MLHRSTLTRLCRARERLRTVDDPAPSVREVAAAIGMSPFHFIRLFRAVFGETPHRCRVNARLDRSKVLLATTESSVTAICMDVGFASLGTFSSLFARRVGLSPSAYRRKVRAMARAPGRLPAELIPGCFALMR